MESKIIILILMGALLVSLTFNISWLYKDSKGMPSIKGTEEINITDAGFANFNQPINQPEEPGVVILRNTGSMPLDSEKFKLFLNKEIQDNDGCELKGEIDPGYTCRLNFYKPCRNGDVIEIKYNNQRVSLTYC